MASGATDLGVQRELERAYGIRALPTNFYLALVTSATAPSQSTTTLSQLTEIAAGNGYASGGYPLTPGATDFPASGITSHKGYVRIKNVQWTANGGAVPASGAVPKYAVLTDDNGTVGSREVYRWWDLGTVSALADGQILSDNANELREAS